MSETGHEPVARIKVIGVGGGGSNAVARMFRERIQGAAYIAISKNSYEFIVVIYE